MKITLKRFLQYIGLFGMMTLLMGSRCGGGDGISADDLAEHFEVSAYPFYGAKVGDILQLECSIQDKAEDETYEVYIAIAKTDGSAPTSWSEIEGNPTDWYILPQLSGDYLQPDQDDNPPFELKKNLSQNRAQWFNNWKIPYTFNPTEIETRYVVGMIQYDSKEIINISSFHLYPSNASFEYNGVFIEIYCTTPQITFYRNIYLFWTH